MKELIEMNYVKNNLDPAWFVQDPIDYEYKIYTLLAFLKNTEDNIENGYWFPDYEILEKRYTDIELFYKCYSKGNRIDLFKSIYEFSKSSEEHQEIIKTIEAGYTLIKDSYFKAQDKLDYILSKMKIFNRTTDKRKSPIYFVQSCGTNIVETYKVGKSSIEPLGSFYARSYSFLTTEENYVQIISEIAISSEKCLIPLARKFIKEGDYF